jgi:hypothetical protein
MPIWRLQVSYALDSSFPRDRCVITPHFNDAGVTTDPESLCTDLADALEALGMNIGELRVSAYDAQGTPPVYPQGEALRRVGAMDTSEGPREIALCLSFFSERNIPRRRGRLYIPLAFVNSAAATLRPSAGQISAVAGFAPIFENLGGADVDWCVFSRVDNAAYPVTNWYVDDEWDVIRSRGLRGTTRTTGTTAEA